MFKQNSRVVIVGDSVTDVGRDRPIGEGNNGLGNGYPRYFDAMLQANCPMDNIRITNAGNSGDSSRSIVARMQTDIIDLKPDYVTLMIGINDIWRQYDLPNQKETHVYIDEYEKNLNIIADAIKKCGAELALISPLMFEPNHDEPMRKTVDAYIKIMEKVAKERGLKFIDVQSQIDKLLETVPTMSITWDRVHPNHVAHYIIADTMAGAFGYDFATRK